jgi:hypothetical protein
MSETPCASTGSIIPLIAIGARRTPNRWGIEYPHTSASRMPTRLPWFASATREVRGDGGLADPALARRDTDPGRVAIGDPHEPAVATHGRVPAPV